MKISKRDKKLLAKLSAKYNLIFKPKSKIKQIIDNSEKEIKLTSKNYTEMLTEITKMKKDITKLINHKQHTNKDMYQADIHIMGYKLLKSGILKEYVTDDQTFLNIQSKALVAFGKNGDYKINSNEYINFMNLLLNSNSESDMELYTNLKHLESAMSKVRILNYKKVKNLQNKQNFADRILTNIAEQYISSNFITYGIKQDCNDINNLLINKNNYKLDYVKNNHVNNSCYFNTIIDVFKKSFDNYHAKHCKSKFKLTKESLYKILFNKDYNNEEVPLTINQSLPFLNTYSLGLEVFDVNYKLLYEVKHEKYHSHIKPSIMRIIYHNNHTYQPTEINSLIQYYNKQDFESMIFVHGDYLIQDYSKKQDSILINTFDELLDTIKFANSKKSYYNIIYNGCLNKLYEDFFLKNGYSPKISVGKIGLQITSILLDNLTCNNKSLFFRITSPGSVMGNIIEFPSKQYLDLYDSSYNNLYKYYINKRNLTYYNEDILHFFNTLKIEIATGKVIDVDVQGIAKYCALDFNKFYASILINNKYLPVVSYFEKPRKYDNHIIQDYYLYQIELTDDFFNRTNNLYNIFNNNNTMIYGKNLKQLTLQYTIHQYIKTIIHKNHGADIIKDLLTNDSELIMDHRKSLINVMIGKLGKKYNKKAYCQSYKNKNDVLQVQSEYGGTIYGKNNIYYHVVKKQKELNNGYLPIHTLIYDDAQMQLFNLTKELNTLKLPIIGYKTDAIFFHKCDSEKVSHLISDENKIGGLKLDCNSLCINKLITQNNTDYSARSLIKEYKKINKIVIDDEYNENELLSKITPNTIVIGCGGSGKSTNSIKWAIKNYDKNKILVVCPYNSQCIKIKKEFAVHSITFHSLTGMKINDDDKYSEYDIENYDIIIYDEIYLYNHRKLIKLYQYMQTHNDKHFIATGDSNQLEAIDDIITNEVKHEYVLSMFNSLIQLYINKRIQSSQLKQLDEIKKALFEGVNIQQIIKQYFKNSIIDINTVNTLNIKKACTYYNTSCETINKFIHHYVNKEQTKYIKVDGIKYVYGQYLVARKTLKFDENKIVCNNTYKLTFQTKSLCYLTDLISPTIKHEIKADKLNKYFKLPYANTVHSLQGNSINEKYVICDYTSKYVDAKWLYVAISRCTDLNNIYFLKTQLYNFNEEEVLTKLINGYKLQDFNAKHTFNASNYVIIKWILNKYINNKNCKYCTTPMSIEHGYIHQLSVNRLDNSKAHIISNCELICKHCNITLKTDTWD